MAESKYPIEWEIIDPSTKRLRIPTGWLVKTSAVIKDGPQQPASISCAMCYVLDSDHRWILDREAKEQ